MVIEELMGEMVHHAIIVTSYDEDLLKKARDVAADLLVRDGLDLRLLTRITEPIVNEVSTFVLVPDGSKEGWQASEAGDHVREQFVAWLDSQRHEDDSTPLKWALVQYGGDSDGYPTKVFADSEQHLRERRSGG